MATEVLSNFKLWFIISIIYYIQMYQNKLFISKF